MVHKNEAKSIMSLEKSVLSTVNFILSRGELFLMHRTFGSLLKTLKKLFLVLLPSYGVTSLSLPVAKVGHKRQVIVITIPLTVVRDIL